MRSRRPRPAPAPRSPFAGRWYLRFGLSYRDVEELLAVRGVEVDHVSVYRWVQRFTVLATFRDQTDPGSVAGQATMPGM
jgi:transposase-like protein